MWLAYEEIPNGYSIYADLDRASFLGLRMTLKEGPIRCGVLEAIHVLNPMKRWTKVWRFPVIAGVDEKTFCAELGRLGLHRFVFLGDPKLGTLMWRLVAILSFAHVPGADHLNAKRYCTLWLETGGYREHNMCRGQRMSRMGVESSLAFPNGNA